AEDAIRYFHVTAVQTCALPICLVPAASSTSNGSTPLPSYFDLTPTPVYPPLTPKSLKQRLADYLQVYIRLRNEAIKRRLAVQYRSEERRVGYEGRRERERQHGE